MEKFLPEGLRLAFSSKKASSRYSTFYLSASYTLFLLLATQLSAIVIIMLCMGRPAKTKQPDYGVHLASLRNAASMSQQQLAERVGVRQATIAAWEHSPTPPRGEFLLPLSEALSVSIEELLNITPKKSARHRGPSSKLESLCEQAAKLPRRRQQRITRLLEAMIAEEAQAS